LLRFEFLQSRFEVKKARFAFKLGGGAKTNKRTLLFSHHNENIFLLLGED
jgi:hypothetical protein